MLDEIEPLGVDDLADCLGLAKDRGWTQRERMWRLLLEEKCCLGVRDQDGNLAGTVVLSMHGRDLAAIGMMLVATRYGGRGIGRRLMEHALAEAGGATVFLYATELGRPLYEKLGFTPVETSHSMAGGFAPPVRETEPTAVDAGRETVRVRPATADDLEAIVDLDATAFGADREPLLRRLPDFTDHLLVAVDHADADEPDAVVGFAASWYGSDATTIGPVIARTQHEARLLIDELAMLAEGAVRLDLDHGRHDLREWAAARGLTERATATAMVRGANSLPGDRSRVFAPLAKAVG